jgi:DNA repair exonuclease SbcCD ATPase subunit
MIIFETIKYKNFLSTGDTFTEINLNKSASTLIVGQNGSGKSTILDALSFVLFGKAHRNINKPQLVNSINQKSMLVTVDFSIGNTKYKINRGLKPTVFEIFKDTALINQDSHNKDYQKVLEQNILKLNHKSFHQIVVLGSSSFVPFMQLPAQHRREVIEDLLDINIFSKMNQILKEKITNIKDAVLSNNQLLQINTTKIEAQQKYIRDLTKLNDEYRDEKNNQIEETVKEIDAISKENEELMTNISALEDGTRNAISKLNNQIRELNAFDSEFKTKMKTLVKNAKFYEDNESCPTCEQHIQIDVKQRRLAETRERAREIQTGIERVSKEVEECQSELSVNLRKIEDAQKLNTKLHSNNETLTRLHKNISTLQKEINNMVKSNDLSQASDDLNILSEECNNILIKKSELSESFSYYQVIGELLKDTGIKTKIIKQYLPVINQLCNQYLQVLDFFVSFNLDDTFKETIKSRHRDVFTYDSFSEGEKQRIDLALLFTWRMIAKMKNSVATNLLILDETFDSSLDADGVENLSKILETLDKDTNVFVISHKGELLDSKFDTKIEFVKSKNFSKMAA